MNKLIGLFFCFLFFVSCARFSVKSKIGSATPFYVGHKNNHVVKIIKPFKLKYLFYGLYPEKRVIYLEDLYQGEGITEASHFEMKVKKSFLSKFLTVATLGLYYPVEGEISFYTNKSDEIRYQVDHPVLEGYEIHP